MIIDKTNKIDISLGSKRYISDPLPATKSETLKPLWWMGFCGF